MEIFAKLLHPDAVAPRYANEGDAGCDLVAVESVDTPTAGAVERSWRRDFPWPYPKDTADFVLPRSGLASRHGVTCANAPGLIDPGYRGELKVALVNLDPDSDYQVEKGDRIAQLVVYGGGGGEVFAASTSYRARRAAKAALAAAGDDQVP